MTGPDFLQRVKGQFDYSMALLLFGSALWIATLWRADFSKMGAYGLISIVGWTYFAGLLCVTAGFTSELFRATMRSGRLATYLVLFVLMIYGTPSAIEPVASLGDSWLHAGFVQYIFSHGSVLNSFDARFSWPGSFSLGAVFVGLAGQPNAVFMLRWFPVFIELMYLAPLLVIANSSGVGRRGAWLGVIIFYSTNWIYQDYFSPQALAIFLLLVVLATVLNFWRPISRVDANPPANQTDVTNAVRNLQTTMSRIGGEDMVPKWQMVQHGGLVQATWRPQKMHELGRGLKERGRQVRAILTIRRIEGHDSVTSRSDNQVLGMMGLLTVICLALSMSHQLTPYALVVMLIGCLFTRRLGRPELIFVITLLAFAWLSLGASNFWVGHLSTIFGSVGQIGTTVGANVTSRIVGAASHQFVVNLRIVATATLYLLAGIGTLRRAANSRMLEVLTGAPVLLLAAQGYGGEGLMRVVLYGLPFAALLAASAILPLQSGSIRPILRNLPFVPNSRGFLRIITTLVVLTLALMTSFVRGGNDSFQAFSGGELAAVNYVYSHYRSGQNVGYIVSYLPIGQRDVGSIATFAVSGVSSALPFQDDETALVQARPTWIILGKSQEAWGLYVAGFPKGWMALVKNYLTTHGYRVVSHWNTADVLKVVKS